MQLSFQPFLFDVYLHFPGRKAEYSYSLQVCLQWGRSSAIQKLPQLHHYGNHKSTACSVYLLLSLIKVFFQFITFSLLSRPQGDKHVLPASGPTPSSSRALFMKPTTPLKPAGQSSTTPFSEDSSNAVWDFILASIAVLSFWTRATPKVTHSRANPASWHNKKLKTILDTSYSVLSWLKYHSLPFLKTL